METRDSSLPKQKESHMRSTDCNPSLRNQAVIHLLSLTLSRQVVSHYIRFNFSNVNISASIYPPLKQRPPLKSSQNNLSNWGSSAVKTVRRPKQSYIYRNMSRKCLKQCKSLMIYHFAGSYLRFGKCYEDKNTTIRFSVTISPHS